MADMMIGTTYETMVYFESSDLAVTEPKADPMDYAKSIELGDGMRRGMGDLRQTWHWGLLTETQRNVLLAYLGPVYVRTLQNAGTLELYTADLLWPEKEPEHYAGSLFDLSLELRRLKVFTPEEP